MKNYAFASLLALTFSAPALAADFDGPRVEARIGGDRVKLSGEYDDGDFAAKGSDHEDGVSFGAEVGYDAAVGTNFTLGAYAGVDFTTADYCSEVFGEDEGCIKAGRNFTAGIRAGVPVGTSTLLYVKGGYSNGRLKVSYEDFEDVLEDFSVGENRGGFHLGAGGEMKLSANTYGKLEYVYTNYNGSKFDDGDFTIGIDGTRHQVLVGVGFRF